jgi:hypothetical protein
MLSKINNTFNTENSSINRTETLRKTSINKRH